MQRPLRPLRRTSLCLVLRRISPHPALHHRSLRRMSLRLALRRMLLRLALRRSGLPAPPVLLRRPWRGMHRPQKPLRLLRSNSRKSAAAIVARELPNRASSPPGRAPQHRGAAATPRDKKTWVRNKVRPSKTRPAARLRHWHNGTEVRDKR
jgi:hypothetical protein